MVGQANPRLIELQRAVWAELRRRGHDGYVDVHVKRIAVYLVMDDINLADLTFSQSFAIGTQVGLSAMQYIAAVEWLDPGHAAALKQHLRRSSN